MRFKIKLISKKIWIPVFIFVLLIPIVCGGYYYVKQRQDQKAQYDKILDGIAFAPIDINANFNDSKISGSPLVFGGAQTPDIKHQDAWNKIQSVGVTSIRKSFFIESEVPKTTLEDYKTNKNDVKNPEHWNKTAINNVNTMYENAKERGIRVIGLVTFAPTWLTYSGTRNGVPMNWDIYEDIVAKAYRFHRPFLDYVEIWNEPTLSLFLDLSNSPYNREDAYSQIFYHAAKAIRSVDDSIGDGKKIPIGGPVGHDPETTRMLEVLLSNKENRNYINFISYHSYGHEEPSFAKYKKILDRYEMGDLPIFITEWNYSPKETVPDTHNSGGEAIAYTGDMLLNFLKEGIVDANYYLLGPINKPKVNNADYMGFYRWENNHTVLVNQSKTWKLLSSDLKLGKGDSKIIPIATSSFLNGIGFINTTGERGLVFVNSSSEQEVVRIKLDDSIVKEQIYVKLYFASDDKSFDGVSYSETFDLSKDDDFRIVVPSQSITGAIISPNNNIFDKIKHLIFK